MASQKNTLAFSLLGFGAMIGALLGILAVVNTPKLLGEPTSNLGGTPSALGMGTAIAVPTNPTPGTGRFVFGSPNLIGATDGEFADFAQDWARHQLKAVGIPEVLFARSITYDELPSLGMGCPPSFMTIEEPPLMLAILRGEFDFRGARPGFRNAPSPEAGKKRYVVYIFDVWAGRPITTISSEDGAVVKKALHDPALPNDPDSLIPSSGCATPVPVLQRRYHYGQPAVGGTVPPHPTPDLQATATAALPAASATIPLPVPTAPDQIPTVSPDP